MTRKCIRNAARSSHNGDDGPGRLTQWPCQLRLVPLHAPYLEHADLLIAADCSAFAYAGIHRDFMHRRITLIGCPRLDGEDYAETLTRILTDHTVKSVTVLRMEVSCCSELESAVRRALQASGKAIPCQTVILTTDGNILE